MAERSRVARYLGTRPMGNGTITEVEYEGRRYAHRYIENRMAKLLADEGEVGDLIFTGPDGSPYLTVHIQGYGSKRMSEGSEGSSWLNWTEMSMPSWDKIAVK